MADYIDRDKYCAIICRCNKNYCSRTSCAIWTAKSEDVAPVVHGKWLYVETDDEHFFLCSVCNNKEYWESNYCPNCGAKMDAEQEEPTNEKQHDS